MKNTLFGLAMASFLLAACNNTTKTANKNSASDNTDTKLIDTAEKGGLVATTQIIKDYLKLKNALAEDNDAIASEVGKNLVTAIDGVDTTVLSSAQGKIFSEIKADSREHAEHIGSNAGNIKHQREHFETLSVEIYELLKSGTNLGIQLYYDNCPMYNRGKGGNWISEVREIRNPYYGKSMLECGSVKEELK